MSDNAVEVIKKHLEEKRTKNPMYSYRCIARDTGISSSQLSRILHGQRRLTPTQAYKLGLYFKLTEQELLKLLLLTMNDEKSDVENQNETDETFENSHLSSIPDRGNQAKELIN